MTLGDVRVAGSANLSRDSSLAFDTYRSSRVRFPAHLDHFEGLWQRLESSLKAMGYDEKDRWQWYLAALELVNNAILHGSESDPARDIVVNWAVVDGQLELSVRDDGKGPPAGVVSEPRLPEDVTQQRGRGLFLIHNFSDSWEHWRSDSGYCCVVRKRLPESAQAEVAPFESVERSVSSLSLFYQLGATILHQSAPGSFFEKGVAHLISSFQVRPRRVSVILSERLPDELVRSFDGYSYIRSSEGAPAVVYQVLRGGRGIDWEGGCCHPIVANNRNLGCLLIETADGVSVSMTESSQARVFADLFGIAMDHYCLRNDRRRDEQFRREAEFATKIQRELLSPSDLPPSPHWEIVHYSATHNLVAGDYQESCYDSEGNLIMAIIDVMGKGATAAIFALMFRTAMHARLQMDFDLRAFLVSFNRTLYDWLGEDSRFITCSMVKIDAKRGALELINAGHCPALFFHCGSLVHQQEASGPPLGVFSDSEYVSERRDLDSVDTLLMVSDGLYEWFEGEQVWGWENFVRFANKSLPFGHDVFWKKLRDRIDRSVDDPSRLDDQTLLWWQRLPTTSMTA